MLPWALCVILFVIASLFAIKLWLMQKSVEEICAQLPGILFTDTNNLLAISSQNKKLKRLAAELNKNLKELCKSRRRFENGDKEIKEAISALSHDLRTPITAIRGYLDLLAEEPKSPQAEKYFTLIQSRAEAMQKLSEELFSFSVTAAAPESLKPQQLCLNSELEESLAAFYAVLKKAGITPDILICEKQIMRSLDKTALSRILGNIISNAVKYSNGDLTVILAENGEICFINKTQSINEVQTGLLFNRYFTLHSAEKSTGIGLNIAKALTEQMGGEINARYQNGRLSITILFK